MQPHNLLVTIWTLAVVSVGFAAPAAVDQPAALGQPVAGKHLVARHGWLWCATSGLKCSGGCCISYPSKEYECC
ncbi:hypothetical protein BST61_g5617 [Cercospora zeina]